MAISTTRTKHRHNIVISNISGRMLGHSTKWQCILFKKFGSVWILRTRRVLSKDLQIQNGVIDLELAATSSGVSLKPSQANNNELPMLLLDGNFIHINTLFEPSLVISKLRIVPTHLPLPHPSVFCERPILKAVGSPPLACFIIPLVPKLHCNLCTGNRSIGCYFRLPSTA
jgi:hypothetical protein